MKYYFHVISNPKSGRYMRPLALYRFEDEGKLITEKWDRKENKWIDFPDLIQSTGIGGDNGDFIPTTNDEALEFMNKGNGNLMQKSEILSKIKNLSKEKIEKDLLKERINNFLKKSEDEKVINEFLSGYKNLAILGPTLSSENLDNTFSLASQVNNIFQFNLILKSEDRVDKVISIDSVAHKMHQDKFADGSSKYNILDHLADISKELGEEDRESRLLVLNGKDVSPFNNIQIFQKSRDFEQGHSYWNLMVKAIKHGVQSLKDDELIILREWIYARI